MTMQVGGVNQNYYNYYDPYNTSNIDHGSDSIYGTSPYQPLTGFGFDPYNMPTFEPAQPQQPKKEEKKVGLFGKIFNGIKGIVKGVVNGAVNLVKGIIKNPLKTLAMVGACFIPGVGPFIAAGLCAYGVAKSAPGVINGIVGIANAQTAEEAEAAGMQVGENGLTLGLSVAGLRTSLGACKAAVNGGRAAATGLKGMDAAKAFTKGAMNPKAAMAGELGDLSNLTWKGLGKEAAQGTWTNVKAFGRGVKDTAKENNPFTKEGRANIREAIDTKIQNVKDIHNSRVSYNTKLKAYQEAQQAIKDAGTVATPEQVAQLNYLEQMIKYSKPSYFDTMNTFNYNRAANATNKFMGTEIPTKAYIPAQEFNYGSFGMLTPAAANLSNSENQGYATDAAGIPLSYNTDSYNPYLYQ